MFKQLYIFSSDMISSTNHIFWKYWVMYEIWSFKPNGISYIVWWQRWYYNYCVLPKSTLYTHGGWRNKLLIYSSMVYTNGPIIVHTWSTTCVNKSHVRPFQWAYKHCLWKYFIWISCNIWTLLLTGEGVSTLAIAVKISCKNCSLFLSCVWHLLTVFPWPW